MRVLKYLSISVLQGLKARLKLPKQQPICPISAPLAENTHCLFLQLLLNEYEYEKNWVRVRSGPELLRHQAIPCHVTLQYPNFAMGSVPVV